MSGRNQQSLSFIIANPRREIEAVRRGIHAYQVEIFLKKKNMPLTEILKRLHIPSSTFFKKKQDEETLNTSMTEKFMRLAHVVELAERVLGDSVAVYLWLDREVPSLGNQKPMDLLDTEPGHRLVEQALLQIEHGVYG